MRILCNLSHVISILTSITFVPPTIQIQAINVFGAKTITLPTVHETLPGTLVTLATTSSTQQEQLTLSAHDGFNDSIPSSSSSSSSSSPYEENELHRNIHQKAQHGNQPTQLNAPINNVSVLNKSNLKVNDFQDNARSRRSVFHVRWNPNEKFVVHSRESPAVNHTKLSPHPRWALSKITKLTLNPKYYVCHDKNSDLCRNKTYAFRLRIVKTFENSLTEATNESNFYNVDFKPLFGDSFEEQYYPSACLVMEAGVSVLRRRDAPFNKLEFGKLFPKQKLFRNVKNVKTCAIVSSAGSMAGSKLGRFIDSHDVVMRFNNAPTLGHEVDVGGKTTIRVVNSQVITKAEFNFNHAPIFQNITIAAWDSGKYNDSLSDWLTNADYDIFTNYEIYRRRYPKSRAFLINPHSIWRLWQSLQMFAGNRPIPKNPPSSGFIGLALLLPHCPHVDFIEYIPSTRLNGRCHYYSKEMNSACTFGAWHPLAAEKLMALDMNIADEMSVFQFGILRIRRPDKLLCGFNFLGY